MYKNCFKRVFDFCIALVALLILCVPLLIVAVWLHFANKGAGAFFWQTRVGKGESLFQVWKFKSMTDERDENGKLLPDAMRITKAGRFVRSTSLDELPQLINVLKGDMALIGPRPLPPDYLPWYDEKEHHRHDVRPGISGWAQVNGRTAADWPDRMAHDVEYVENLSLAFDLKVLYLTVYKVFKRENVGEAKMKSYNFDDYSRRRWTEQGREDLIAKAEVETAKIREMLKQQGLR